MFLEKSAPDYKVNTRVMQVILPHCEGMHASNASEVFAEPYLAVCAFVWCKKKIVSLYPNVLGQHSSISV